MGTVEILTPYDRGECVELASGIFRKQILPLRAIRYTAKDGSRRRIDFNRQYLKDLTASFRGKAFDEVALQMADGANTHTLDPERKRAEVVGLEVADDGMYALVKPNNEKAAQFLRENPKMGVSARIIEGMNRSDGQQFGRALHHVLVTTDPQIPGLKPWEEVEAVALASGGPDESIDLSGASYEGNNEMPPKPGTNSGGEDGDKVTLELTAAQADRLNLLLNDDEAAARALAGAIELTDPEDDDEDDVDPDALELIRGETELANQRVLELTARLNNAEIANEVDRLRQSGLAPAIIEAARPLLQMQTGAVELSNATGTTVDPGAVVRAVLDTVVQLDRSGLAVVDLGRVDGSYEGADVDPLAAEREAALSAWTEAYGS